MDLPTQLYSRRLFDQDIDSFVLQLHCSFSPELPPPRPGTVGDQSVGQRIDDSSLRLYVLSHQRRVVIPGF
jgi:hypothetical protein